MDDFESYINSIDEGYDAGDCIFNGYIYKLYIPQFHNEELLVLSAIYFIVNFQFIHGGCLDLQPIGSKKTCICSHSSDNLFRSIKIQF